MIASHLDKSVRRGLTLVELLVVILVLAILTTVAVQSMEPMIQQAKFDATRKTLSEIQTAVLGPSGTTSNDPHVSFIGDVGRLPLTTGSDAETQAAELWSNPNGLPEFAFHTSTNPNDTDVQLGSGWRGPYLRLPVGQSRLVDGFGNPFLILQDDLTTPVAAGLPIASFTALGTDQAIGSTAGAPYTNDISLTIPFISANYTGTIAGTVVDSEPTSTAANDVTVTLFIPDAREADGIREVSKIATATGGYAFTFDGITDQVTIGPKAIRVKQLPRKSVVIYFNVPAGGLTRNLTLDIQ